ncbi:MAG: PAS domain-containing protein [Propionibacteriales bacterium]|nr:PAS domain-containing protein [Propionibacteriales bacterium]
MPSLNEVVRQYTDLTPSDLDWLHLLVADWQIIADLSFADLILWVPNREGDGFWAAAQMRPTTGPTAFMDDIVGSFAERGRRPLVDAAFDRGRIVREGDPEWRDEVPVRVETIPVRREGSVLGVIARNTNLMGVRTPSRLELAYLQTATDLTKMISDGHFPIPGSGSEQFDSPRVGDGFVRLDASGVVTYASPNAQSAYRRFGFMGDLLGERIGELTASLLPASDEPVDESLQVVVAGRQPRGAEVENSEATLVLRSIPLRPAGAHIGGLVLMRDVTELRRRERELMSKDALIREIHHRVKNNLQTVAALLRIQARRINIVEGREALDEAVHRVGSIAIVHETLSQNFEDEVEFDEVADRLLAMVVEVSTTGTAVRTRRRGSFGTLPPDIATPLAMVLTELLQNAVHHGLGDSRGRVVLRVDPDAGDGTLCVHVEDNGVGLPSTFDPHVGTLGMSIVTTLVDSELRGELSWGGTPSGGTRMTLTLPVQRVAD